MPKLSKKILAYLMSRDRGQLIPGLTGLAGMPLSAATPELIGKLGMPLSAATPELIGKLGMPLSAATEFWSILRGGIV